MKRTATIEWSFSYPAEQIWRIITDNEDTGWRSDLDKVEVHSETVFTEYFKGGGETIFTITELIENQRYQFDMENKFFKGKWSGELLTQSNGGTKVIFTEELTIGNPLIWFFSFFMMPLRKIQETYMKDLEKKLTEDAAGSSKENL